MPSPLPATMRAAVLRHPGGPEVLAIEQRPLPRAGPGEVLIKVEAFGINRSELFTRRGQSPGVILPRIPGIEATGIVMEAPGDQGLRPFDKVATVMGGMGRAFDGGYAEYVRVPARQVRRVQSTLPWPVLGALPEMLQTAWGALFRVLGCESGDRLLIRGGTTSVGLVAAQLARRRRIAVAATTRQSERLEFLQRSGISHPLLDQRTIAEAVRTVWPGGADKVLELVGTGTLLDSLASVRKGGRVCMAGMVGDSWTLSDFEPMMAIPSGVSLTTYSGDVDDFMAMPLQEMVEAVERNELAVPLGPTFRLSQIAEAHRCMESNLAMGKIVVIP